MEGAHHGQAGGARCRPRHSEKIAHGAHGREARWPPTREELNGRPRAGRSSSTSCGASAEKEAPSWRRSYTGLRRRWTSRWWCCDDTAWHCPSPPLFLAWLNVVASPSLSSPHNNSSRPPNLAVWACVRPWRRQKRQGSAWWWSAPSSISSVVIWWSTPTVVVLLHASLPSSLPALASVPDGSTEARGDKNGVAANVVEARAHSPSLLARTPTTFSSWTRRLAHPIARKQGEAEAGVAVVQSPHSE